MKGEDFIKLKVEGHSRAAAAATLGRLAWVGTVAASQLLFPRKEKPHGSGLLPIQLFAGAKRAVTDRELDHADSCQGVSFSHLRQAHPWQIALVAPSYGLRVFSACPWGWHREGERGPCRISQGDHGDIWKRGNMGQRWLCVARRNGARKGEKKRFSFSG